MEKQTITRPSAVIFDMDGVIIHNNEWHLKSWLLFAQKLGIDLKEEEFPTRVFGKTNEEILWAAFPNQSPEQIEKWALEKEALYREMYSPFFKLADGLVDFLDALRREQIPVAVASNAPLVNVDFALDKGSIRSYFQCIMYAGLVERPKPAPDIYLESARHLGFSPDQCLVIEDSPTGLQAAKAAGCPTAAITSTYPRTELEVLSRVVFDSFAELQQRLFS
jgi:beta-phosphoglucomutase